MNTTPSRPVPLPPETRRFVHDLRNCLASVRAGASMLRRSAHQPQIIEKVADGLHEQVQEMLDLVDTFIGRAPGPAHAASNVSNARSSATDDSLRILVADDNADAANTLATYLRLSGHRPIVALDGREALKLANDEPPDVILLDIGMPIVSGYDVARAIRTETWGASVRLIAVSGWFSAEDVEQATQAGFDAHITKPIDLDALPRVLQPTH